MATSKYFNATRGVPNDALFMSPYLGLKLGLSDLVCLPASIFQQEAASLNMQQGPLYDHLVEKEYNRELSSIFDELPNNMLDDIISFRSEKEYAVFMINVANNLKYSQLHGANLIRAAIDVLKNPSGIETENFFYYLENSDDDVLEFYRYTSIGATESYATTLEKAVGAIDNIYEKQCREIKKSGAAYNVDPTQITRFNAVIERMVMDKATGRQIVDKENSFTLKPNQFIDAEW